VLAAWALDREWVAVSVLSIASTRQENTKKRLLVICKEPEFSHILLKHTGSASLSVGFAVGILA
jgi:hypothetical protein